MNRRIQNAGSVPGRMGNGGGAGAPSESVTGSAKVVQHGVVACRWERALGGERIAQRLRAMSREYRGTAHRQEPDLEQHMRRGFEYPAFSRILEGH